MSFCAQNVGGVVSGGRSHPKWRGACFATIRPARVRRRLFVALLLVLGLWVMTQASIPNTTGRAHAETGLEDRIVVTQLPAEAVPATEGLLRATYGEGARLILVRPDGSSQVLSEGFHCACDPDVSFDGTRLLFAGKKTPTDNWTIYEMAFDDTSSRQITRNLGDCRSPGYQSSLYTLKPVGVPSEPEYHVTFVAGAGTIDEYGGSSATNLYSCRLIPAWLAAKFVAE